MGLTFLASLVHNGTFPSSLLPSINMCPSGPHELDCVLLIWSLLIREHYHKKNVHFHLNSITQMDCLKTLSLVSFFPFFFLSDVYKCCLINLNSGDYTYAWWAPLYGKLNLNKSLVISWYNPLFLFKFPTNLHYLKKTSLINYWWSKLVLCYLISFD